MSSDMTLPNSVAGITTETSGFIESEPATFVDWLLPALGGGWSALEVGPASVRSLLDLIPAGVGPLSRYLVLGADGWTVVLSDGPGGTDLGVLPSRAARDLHVTAIRATAVDPESDSFGAAILEVFDWRSTDPQLCLRSVFAADDGGRWRFGESGDRFEFEDVRRYGRRTIRERLSPDLVREYLSALEVPALSFEAEVSGFLVEKV